MKRCKHSICSFLTALCTTLLVVGTMPLKAAPIDVRSIFQLEGDAMDTVPTSGQALSINPPASLPGLDDGQGVPVNVDDWGKFDSDHLPGGQPLDGTPDGVDFVVGGDCINDPESCGHVAGPEDSTQPDVGESPDPLASLDGHTGGNSFVHFYKRDPNQLTNGSNTDDGFVQGTSLNLDICEWRWTTHNNPAKSDLENTMGTFYSVINESESDRKDFMFYGGASVQAPNGSVKVGYWLLLRNLVAVPDGGFPGIPESAPFEGRFMPEDFDYATDPDPCLGLNASGGRNELHTPGDIMFANDYENGGTDVITRIFEWQRPIEANDGFLVEIDTLVDSNCQDAPAPSTACATANADPNVAAKDAPRDTYAPETYLYDSQKKDDPPNNGSIPTDSFGFLLGEGDYPGTTFFEGGLNLTEELSGEVGCFQTFIPITSASFSLTSAMKDFVIGQLPLCDSSVRTEIHKGTDHNTDIQNTMILAGTTIHDFVEITGDTPGILVDPTGSVNIKFFDNGTCSGEEMSEETVVIIDDLLADNTATVEGSDHIMNLPGMFSFLATYSGDENYPPGTAACEKITVQKLNSTIRTEIHETTSPPTHVDITGGTLFVGAIIHDFAEVKAASSPAGKPDPTGNVVFKFYHNNTCSDPVQSSPSVALVPGTADDGTSTAETGNFGPLAAGGYSFEASYSGDVVYNSASKIAPACETLTVQKFTPGITTSIILKDKATVSKHVGAPVDPTGDVTFDLYTTNDCTGTKVSQTVALTSLMAVSNEITISTTGQSFRSYVATYNGDTNYNNRTHACEVVTIDLPAPTAPGGS